ncbi:MAG: hypothetical protein ACO3RB_00170 [Ilumatobacteraceae bacterium]|jgi:uncharacterized protein YoxC
MKRMSESLFGVSLFAVAASVVAVGVVWASGSAEQDTVRLSAEVVTTLPPGDGPGGDAPDEIDGTVPPVTPDEPGRGDDIDELTAIVRDLGEQVESLAATVAGSVETVESLEKKVSSVVSEFDGLDARVNEGLAKIDGVGDDVAQAKADAAAAVERVGTLTDAVTALQAKTSKLADDGTYTGTVKPSQLSPRLTTNDVSGNWPLNRVSERLRSENIEVNAWGCSTDYRFNTVLVVSAFRQIECVRIPK